MNFSGKPLEVLGGGVEIDQQKIIVGLGHYTYTFTVIQIFTNQWEWLL